MIKYALLIAAMAAAPVSAVPGDASSRAVDRADAREQISIRFREAAVVDGGAIRLGDVARILAGGERAVSELEVLEIGQSAAFGLTRVIDADHIANRVLQPFSGRYAFDLDRKSIKVTTRSAALARDSLAAMLDAFVDALPGHAGTIRKWEITRAPADIRVPAGPHSLELAFAGAKRKGKVELRLSIKDSSRTLRQIPITINLRVEEPVLVAKARIDRDQPLGEGNVAVEMRETTLMNEGFLGEPKRLIGHLAKMTLVPGRIITPRVVAIPPLVRRGQEAKLIYRNGAVVVATGAVCRQDGLAGEIITAKSLASQRLVRVRVAEDGSLEPVPGG